MGDRPMAEPVEQALRDAQAYAESIVDTMRDPLLVLDAGLRVVSASREFYRTFGVTPEETQGRLVYDLGNRQWDIPRLRTLLEEVLPRQTTFRDFEVEHVFEQIGRKVMLLNARKLHREQNASERILLVIEDVTERRDAENARREAETRFTEMVKNVRDHSIFLTDPNGVITSWNVAAERVMGYTGAEAVGRHFSLIFTPEDLERGLPEWELRTAREEGRAEDERWHVRKDGGRFWALGIVTPLRDDGGRLTGFSKILRDITDRKRMEEALRDADRRKDEFLAMLGHELRTPLAPLRGVIDTLRRQRLDGDALERAYAMMDRQVAHLGRLVDDLLDVSRISRGLVDVRKEPIGIAQVADQAVEMANPAIEGRGHELSVALPRKPLRVAGDAARLTQVVFNLLNNAAKYTEPGGRIWLSVERAGDDAVVRVRDNGSGMSPTLLPKVFDLFAQGERTLDRSQGGLGLGLTLVKRLVEMHGGTVEALSPGVGEGSEFVVRLPALPAEAEKRPAAAPPGVSQPSVQVGRALVVDDNFDVAEALTWLLRGLAREVRMAQSGAEAVETVRDWRPELVLCDIGMPGMNGYETCRRLRQAPGMAGVLIAAVSGDDVRRQSQEAGFDRHLVKPIGWETLEELIRSAVKTESL
jgi:PAS domain S-box-containing protein